MPHNDLHKTERQLRSGASKNTKSTKNLPKDIAKPKTAPETQSLADCIDFNTLMKIEGAHIYTRTLPGENGKKTLRIDGPGDSAVALDTEGTIRLITGQHDPNRGAASGKLLIKSAGQQQMHSEPSIIQYNAGGENKEAWNVLAYGDVVHEARGSEYTIRAQKITLIADEELSIQGHGGVKIQAGQSGKGTIDMVCGTLTQRSVNYEEIIQGQRKTTGVSEQSTEQFDPRASVNIVSAGSINHKILGDLKEQIGGAYSMDVLGKKIPGGLLGTDTSLNTYQVKTLVGNSEIQSVAGKTTVSAQTGVDIKTTTGNIDISAIAGNVDINGLLILLN